MNSRLQFQSFLDQLEQQIGALPFLNQMAFAASCCERAFPNYRAFSESEKWGDANLLRVVLDRVWSLIDGKPLSSEEAKAMESQCRAATPSSDDFSNRWADAAQEAAFMITLLLQWTSDQNPHYAVRIAAFARDTIDSHVQVQDKLSPADPNLEEKIEMHPLMVSELANQKEDLDTLAKIMTRAQLREFRDKANPTGRSNIGL